MQAKLFIWSLFGLFFTANGCVPLPPPSDGKALPTVLSIDSNSITLGGFSSGAAFATQFHVAYSSIIKGIGIWCGLPMLTWLQTTDAANGASSVSVEQLTQDTMTLELANSIDSTENLANSKVFLVHGADDTVVDPLFAKLIEAYYEGFNVDMNAKAYYKNASHSVVSNRRGTPCGEMNYPTFVENCNEDTVFEMFEHLLPNVQLGPVNDGELSSALQTFNQVEFFDYHGFSSMSETGYYYLPDACNGNANSCHLHVFFHGCTMSTDNIGTEFLENSGLLEMAEANQIVMLFPQIKNSWFLGNPTGCWNFLGYLGDLSNGAFATKDATQMRGIYKMITRMTGGAV